MRRDVRAREWPDCVMAREPDRGEPLRVAAGEPCLADQSLENQRFALQHGRIGWAMRVAAVYRNCVKRIDPFQREALVRLIGIQPLADGILRRFAEIVKVVLPENFCCSVVGLLDAADAAVFPDTLRKNAQSGFLLRFPEQGLDRRFRRLDPAAGELVVGIFSAVDHGGPSAAKKNGPRGIALKNAPCGVVILGVHRKQQMHGSASLRVISPKIVS